MATGRTNSDAIPNSGCPFVIARPVAFALHTHGGARATTRLQELEVQTHTAAAHVPRQRLLPPALLLERVREVHVAVRERRDARFDQRKLAQPENDGVARRQRLHLRAQPHVAARGRQAVLQHCQCAVRQRRAALRLRLLVRVIGAAAAVGSGGGGGRGGGRRHCRLLFVFRRPGFALGFAGHMTCRGRAGTGGLVGCRTRQRAKEQTTRKWRDEHVRSERHVLGTRWRAGCRRPFCIWSAASQSGTSPLETRAK